MSRVTTRNNWGYQDYLDDEELREGERIVVTWPDGTESEHQVVTEMTKGTALDHGNYTGTLTVEAFVEVECHGAKVRVRLYGSGAEVKRVEVGTP